MPLELALADFLGKIAKNKAWCDDDDFNIYDGCGGNYDDAYSGGCDDGEILLARYILQTYNKEEEQEKKKEKSFE